ncbi:MAG: MOSC domain-containing protein [Anaerolineales bacterium]
MAKDLHAKVESLLITPQFMPGNPVDEVEVTWEGFVGDKHYGLTMRANSSQKPYPKDSEVRNVRQISIVSEEELTTVAASMELPAIEPGWVGANLMLSGVPGLTQLPSGSRLYFENGVGIVIEGENLPCTTAGGSLQKKFPDRPELTTAFPKKAIGKRGLVAWVEKPGIIRKGETVMIRRAEDIHT